MGGIEGEYRRDLTTLLLTLPVLVLTSFDHDSKMKDSFKDLAPSKFISYKYSEEIWRVRFGLWGHLTSPSLDKVTPENDVKETAARIRESDQFLVSMAPSVQYS